MKVRSQSSTEFLAILAAVAAFSVVALAVYAHFSSAQSSLYKGISGISGNLPGQASKNTVGAPHIDMYMVAPNTTTVNKSTGVYLIVDGQGAISVLASASGQGISVYPSWQNSTFRGFGILEFTAIAGSSGAKSVSIEASATSGNTTITRNQSVVMIALQGPSLDASNPASVNASFTGSIVENGQQRMDYYVSKPSQIYNVTYWSHCTYIGFFGGILPEPAQCGANTWGFDTGDSSCNVFAYDGDNRFYCFALQGDNANASSIGQQSGYLYNITLRISNASLALQATLTDNASSGELINSNGGEYGYAEITSVYAPDVYPVPYLAYAVLGKQNRISAVNISAYSNYSSMHNQVTQLLNIYNSTGGADLGYIEGLISELNRSASRLASSQPVNGSACLPTSQSYPTYYSCTTHSLNFNILVHLNGSQYSSANKTFYIGSSVVKVEG